MGFRNGSWVRGLVLGGGGCDKCGLAHKWFVGLRNGSVGYGNVLNGSPVARLYL